MRHKLEHHLAVHRDEPQLQMTYSLSRAIDGEGASQGPVFAARMEYVSARDFLVENHVRNGSAAIVRREALEEVELFCPDLVACYDLDHGTGASNRRRNGYETAPPMGQRARTGSS